MSPQRTANPTGVEKVVYGLAVSVFTAAAAVCGYKLFMDQSPPPSLMLVVGYGLSYIKDFLTSRESQRLVEEVADGAAERAVDLKVWEGEVEAGPKRKRREGEKEDG